MNQRSILIGAILAGAAAAGYLAYVRLAPHEEQPPAASAPASPTNVSRELKFPEGAPQLSFVKSETVEAHPEPLLDPLNARIAYDENHTARISSPIAGRVLRIAAQPGDRVAAGQALLVIDAPDYAQALADTNKAAADLRQKQAAYRRVKELVDAEVAARRELEAADADFKQAEAEHARAAARLNNLTRGQGTAGPEFTLRSGMAGIVAERKVNPGAEVRPDLPDPLFVVTDPTHLWVLVDLPERLLGAVERGQQVSVEVDAYPKRSFPARVANIGEVVDPATRRIQVRCVLDNPERLLKPEMYARVTPLARTGTQLPRVPNSALITEGVYAYVFVETAPGTFVKRRVVPGLQGRSESYLKDGLRAGERVVTSGTLLLNAELEGS